MSVDSPKIILSPGSVVMKMQEGASRRIIYFLNLLFFLPLFRYDHFKTFSLAFPCAYSGANVAVFQRTYVKMLYNILILL